MGWSRRNVGCMQSPSMTCPISLSNRLDGVCGTLLTSTFSRMYRLVELDLSFNKFTISSQIILNHLPKIDINHVFFIGNEFKNIDPQSFSTQQLVRRKIAADRTWKRVSTFAYFLHFNRLHLKRLAYLESLRSSSKLAAGGGEGEGDADYDDEHSIRESLMASTVISPAIKTNFNSDSLRIFSNIFENEDFCRIIGSFL